MPAVSPASPSAPFHAQRRWLTQTDPENEAEIDRAAPEISLTGSHHEILAQVLSRKPEVREEGVASLRAEAALSPSSR